MSNVNEQCAEYAEQGFECANLARHCETIGDDWEAARNRLAVVEYADAIIALRTAEASLASREVQS